MKIYAKVNESGQIIDMKKKAIIADGYIEMSAPRPQGDWHARADGKWYAGDPAIELNFVSEEAGLISNELLKHEDEDPSAIASETAWREYRKQLRRWNWQDNDYFPDPAHRPVRPQ